MTQTVVRSLGGSSLPTLSPLVCVTQRPQKQPKRARRREQSRFTLSAQNDQSEPEAGKGELLPEEDWTVPGGYQDSLSKNTQLGKAVDNACKELDTLGELEKDSLIQANELLKKLGYKGDITAPQIPPKVKREENPS